MQKYSRSYGFCISASERKEGVTVRKTELIDTINRDEALRYANNLAEERVFRKKSGNLSKKMRLQKREVKKGMYAEDIPGSEGFI